MRIPFTQVDAFADRPFAGNPAAVMLLAAWLDDPVLQSIAAENNLSETAFLVPTDGDADFELRWFTPVDEVRLCGHATLASGHVVLTSDTARSSVRFRTRQAGVLEVSRVDATYQLALTAWKPAAKPLPDMVAALGVVDVVETLWRDGGYGVIVLADEAAVRRVTPDFTALALLGNRQAIVTAKVTSADVVSRMFAPGAGIDEDPVTGSAHAVIVPYWAERLGCDSFTAHQASARGGRLHCTLDGDRVILGGDCVTMIEGVFLLQ